MNQSKANGLSYIRANNAKTMHAVEATPRQNALFAQGEELGAQAADNAFAWEAAIKSIKTPLDRASLKAGFVSAYMPLRGCTEKSAKAQFDRLAKLHAPHTSRQAKANAKRAKGGGRKEKTATGKASKLSEKDVAARMVKALAYISKAQSKHAGDSEMLEVLGEIAAILGGK